MEVLRVKPYSGSDGIDVAGNMVDGKWLQALQLALGGDDATEIVLIDAGHPVPVALFSPPYSSIGPGGETVAPAAEMEVVPAFEGRVMLTIAHRGDPAKTPGDPTDASGPVWLGFDAAASGDDPGEELGLWLESGDEREVFFAGAVRVRNPGSVAVRVNFHQWGA